MRGFGFQGGHPEDHGLGPDGKVIRVPLHHHEVSLDLTRFELEVGYRVKPAWDVVLRLPYDIKSQSAGIRFDEPVSEAERQAIFRNRDIHHRTQTYRGFSDAMVVVSKQTSGLWRDGDSLKLGAGASLPLGTTEENPYALGDMGLEHLHIQFGNGTFDPLLEFRYSLPLPGRFSLNSYAFARLPVYQNSKGYQGARELTAGLSVNYRLSDRVFVHASPSLYYQHFAYWSGEKDLNTGLLSSGMVLGGSIRLAEGLRLGADFRQPLSQRSLLSGDAFQQGRVLVVRISAPLRF